MASRSLSAALARRAATPTTANPWEDIAVAVTRIDPGHRDDAPFRPGRAILPAVVLATPPVGPASVTRDDVASPALAEAAQRTVLDRYVFDPKSDPPANASVTHTLAGGVLVHGCRRERYRA